MSLAPGIRLGSYEVTAQIGVGGMGEVYRATDTNLKRQVAIKVLPDSVATDRERLARFQREAEVLAALNHPNIAQIYGIEKSNGQVALIMELVEGPTLADRIAKGRIPVDEALPIAKQTAEALETAHEQGIVHRDLKPANIKVRADGTVKVLDFGLAKALEPAGLTSASASMSPTITSPAMTEMGMILGTAAYMSPEQARGKIVDKRADIWAFGVVLYEMLTGKRVFEGEDISLTLAEVMKAEPDWTALPRVPPAVEMCLRQSLKKDPRQRLRDIGEMRLALEGAFGFDTPTTPERATTPAWRRGLPWAAAAALAVALALTLRTSSPDVRALSRYRITPEAPLFTGGGGQPAMAPDGRTLVYLSEDARGVAHLYRHPLDRLDAVLLDPTEGARHPFFSPSGQRLGFISDDAVKVIPLTGGAAVTLLSSCDGSCRGGTWHGNTIVVGNASGPLRGITDTGANSGTIGALDTAAGEISQTYPDFLPDGRSVLYTSWSGATSSARVAVVDLDTGRSRVIGPGMSPRYVPSGHVVYAFGGSLWAAPFDVSSRTMTGDAVEVVRGIQVNGGGLAIYAVSAGGSLAYVPGGASRGGEPGWADRASGTWSPLGIDADRYYQPRVSPDGRRVALVRGGPGARSIWVYEAGHGLDRITFGSADNYPTWSPDGKQIAYTAGGQLRRAMASGASGTELILDETNIRPHSWSASGDLIVAYGDDSTGWNVGRVRVGQDSKIEPLLDTQFDEQWPALSPDGRWLAYVSNESGRDEVLVRPYPDVRSDRRKVSTEGGTDPRWNGSSSTLFYRQGANLMAVSVDARGSFGVPQVVQTRWYQARQDGGYDVAPAGNRFLVVADATALGQQEAQSVVVVENWIEELKRLVPTK